MANMTSQVEKLSNLALSTLASQPPNERVVIGIAGVPGSGKTTLAAAVAEAINKSRSKWQIGNDETEDIAVAIPMDGFHYSRAHLAQMPNPEEAIHRRGAAFTFDGDGFLALIKDLKASTDRTIFAPSFGHEIKDPIANAIPIHPNSRIVLIEGNYCALDRVPWRQAAFLMSLLWYIDTPPGVAHQRLAKRHLESGIVADEKEAWERATGTDELNAQDIRNNLLKVDEVIRHE